MWCFLVSKPITFNSNSQVILCAEQLSNNSQSLLYHSDILLLNHKAIGWK